MFTIEKQEITQSNYHCATTLTTKLLDCVTHLRCFPKCVRHIFPTEFTDIFCIGNFNCTELWNGCCDVVRRNRELLESMN